jgi:FkbM family methyltransferase
MAFPNARRILKGGLSLSTFKLLVMQAALSRPFLRRVGQRVIQLFIQDGEVALRYKCHGRHYTAYVRMSDMSSDLFTLKELAAGNDVYHLDPGFQPDLVVDGGANVGLFTMLAAALYPSAKIVVCEPVPRNLQQIERHLRVNRVDAEILPICLGGTRRNIPFFVRESIGSSFDPEKPYHTVLDVDVVTLCQVLEGRDANRILIKLDIEGMELEALDAYVPSEKRPVCVVGELHGRRTHGTRLQQIFDSSGWSLIFRDSRDTDSIFEARSPAAGMTASSQPRSNDPSSQLTSG